VCPTGPWPGSRSTDRTSSRRINGFLQQPRPSIKEHSRDLVFKACSLFRGQIEALIEAEEDYIK